ncbi:outer membrane protein transport protein [Thiohalobacter sp. IOR34]|uniref:OmpP1/FadL family transporter n=1 Tax=Thiohalobacter sp. IOR34 TaxID=3057176 RepID=UPI0025B280DD|nr:outer membrane protein transport protein [Thiohalobacter sp. IOR34]WJW75208.1 outer membrane protein transport protein [Thiohalobacter sp. IOR34]
MKHAVKPLLAAMLVAGTATPTASFATNGMFMIGFGTKARGVGGAAIAFPQDSLAGAVNPAAIRAFNTRIDVGADYFRPMANASIVSHTGDIEWEPSRANTFLIPNMGGAMRFNRKLSFGFSAVGAGGGGSRYNRNLYNLTDAGKDPNKTLGVNLMVMQMNPTIAFRASKNHSIGASLIMSVQTFRAFGLDQFAQFTKDQLPLPARGNDWAYGAGVRIGWLGKFMKKKLTLGASASSKVYMTKFEKYKDLFAEQGNFDTPPILGFGAAYKVNKKLTVAMDITRIFYSQIPAVSNPGPVTTGGGSPFINGDRDTYALGNDKGLGFGWENQTAYKLGINYDYSKEWSFRAGWNYAKSPIPEKEGAVLFNIVAPATTQHHLTLGASYRPSNNSEVSFSYVHAFKFKQKGPTYIGTQGEIEMYQNSVGASYAYYF